MDKLKKREIIKNIAIVFLVIMLILTFFSNTIMNRTLPEVSTQNVTSGTVTTQVRGEGIVEAEDPYNLVVDETRKVKSVLKSVGDHVEIGDVIYNLEGETSEELTTEKNDLLSLRSDYDGAILESGLTQAEVSEVEAGVTATTGMILTTLEKKDAEITSLKSSVSDYEKKIADIDKQIELLGLSGVDTSREERAVEEAEKALADAKEVLDKYMEALALIEAKNEAQANYNAALKALSEAEAKMKKAKEDMDAAEAYYLQKRAEYDAIDPSDTAAKEIAADEMRRAYEDYLEKQKLYQESVKAVEEAKKAVAAAKEILDEANSIEVIAPTEEEIAQAKANIAAREEDLKKAKQALEDKKNSNDSTNGQKNNLEKQKVELKSKMDEINSKLTLLEEERKEYLSNEQTKIGLEKKYKEILKKEESIKVLEEKALGGEIKSPVAGEITSLSSTAGERFEAGSTVAVIQIDGKGYKLSFSVTSKQAKSVKVGDEVSIVNSWYYGDLNANLVAIQPDKNNTRDGKILVFSLTGESIQPGQNITLSVGEKSSNYDLIVPLSAVREDNNGNFVLIMDTKSTPFGSRYIAKRVDAKVLAKDDKVAAIDAELYGYEYVITNASKHLENGDQVKLAE
ncbi:MAG: HlyD family efflux transporter periplasmic adaptor subunit [Lachnospiraceae bacterium]|nr:HlyD family efflux transporter periplasmic adaptor subunit [Lachnospiraceae bacterium]